MPEARDFAAIRRELADAPCLSVRQPWAELILLGRKKVEIRSWETDHRGWVWLHTGRMTEAAECDRFDLQDLYTGGFVGAFRLRDVVPFDPDLWEAWRGEHLDQGGCVPGSFGWVIADALRLSEPEAAPGNVRLFSPAFRPESAFVGEA